MADEFNNVSPYNYGLNNPLRFINPTGMAPLDIRLKGVNNSGLTVKTDIVDVSLDVSSLGIDFGGNYTLADNDVLEAALDIGGLVDPTGIIDGAAAVYHGNNSDWGNAIISGLSVAPGGDLLKLGKVSKHIKTVDNVIDGAKSKNLADGAEKRIPKSQLGPSGKPKIHTVSKPNQKQAKDAARNNPSQIRVHLIRPGKYTEIQ